MTTMTIRCDENDKKAAQEVAEYYGFDLSSVTRAFWKQMARTHTIPLNLGNEIPNDETSAALREGAEIMSRGGTGKSYETAEDMLAAIRAER